MNDSYLKECEAIVEDMLDDKILFDQTIFYAEGGGQPSDVGTISFEGRELEIVKVKKKDGNFFHYVSKGELPSIGTKVLMKINWDMRYKLMRMHSAQHVISAYLLDKFGVSTVGNQLNIDKSRLDVSPLVLEDVNLEEIEKDVNEILEKDISVLIYEKEREEIISEVDPKRRLLFSRIPEFVKKIQVVEVEGKDKCPCGGTHVKSTKEIGKIKMLEKKNKGKGVVRLSYELI